jgi:formate hydrogenlyase transcriptional activator
LRERREDIPLLVQYFLSKFPKRMKKDIESVPPNRMQALVAYSWPGNIRELEHLIERAVILTRGSVLNVPPFEPVAAEEVLPITPQAHDQEAWIARFHRFPELSHHALQPDEQHWRPA